MKTEFIEITEEIQKELDNGLNNVCDFCVFQLDDKKCQEAKCMSSEREDKKSGYFIEVKD